LIPLDPLCIFYFWDKSNKRVVSTLLEISSPLKIFHKFHKVILITTIIFFMNLKLYSYRSRYFDSYSYIACCTSNYQIIIHFLYSRKSYPFYIGLFHWFLVNLILKSSHRKYCVSQVDYKVTMQVFNFFLFSLNKKNYVLNKTKFFQS